MLVYRHFLFISFVDEHVIPGTDRARWMGWLATHLVQALKLHNYPSKLFNLWSTDFKNFLGHAPTLPS